MILKEVLFATVLATSPAGKDRNDTAEYPDNSLFEGGLGGHEVPTLHSDLAIHEEDEGHDVSAPLLSVAVEERMTLRQLFAKSSRQRIPSGSGVSGMTNEMSYTVLRGDIDRQRHGPQASRRKGSKRG